MHLSVVIPAHNPAPLRLRRVLSALLAQEAVDFEWEIIVVDNASNPPIELPADLIGIAERCRIVREPQAGLTYARERGMREASGNLWVSVDDDNVLGPRYLKSAADYMLAHPEVGALGGAIIGEFTTQVPSWFYRDNHQWRLALRDFGPTDFVATAEQCREKYPFFAPVGAGMVLRRVNILRYLEWAKTNQSRLQDRTGNHLGTCGDSELVMQAAVQLGNSIAYSPALRMQHLIPDGRLRYRYLLRMAFQTAQTWADFQVRYNYEQPIGRIRSVIRCGRAFFSLKAWTKSGLVNWCEVLGYQLRLGNSRCG